MYSMINLYMNAPKSGATITLGEVPVFYNIITKKLDNEVTVKLKIDENDITYFTLEETLTAFGGQTRQNYAKEHGIKAIGIVPPDGEYLGIIQVEIYDCSLITNHIDII